MMKNFVTKRLVTGFSRRFATETWKNHPNAKRIKNMTIFHERLMTEIDNLVEIEDSKERHTKWETHCLNLVSHHDFEEIALFPYWEADISSEDVNILKQEHIALMDRIIYVSRDCSQENLLKYKKVVQDHFTKEEDLICPLLLNMDNREHRRFRISCMIRGLKYVIKDTISRFFSRK